MYKSDKFVQRIENIEKDLCVLAMNAFESGVIKKYFLSFQIFKSPFLCVINY